MVVSWYSRLEAVSEIDLTLILVSKKHKLGDVYDLSGNWELTTSLNLLIVLSPFVIRH